MVNFEKAVENLRETGFNPLPQLVHVKIPNAKEALWQGIRYLTGDMAKWVDEYNEVAEWLTDNQGRGLFCVGNCGRGKTLICGRIIPVLLNHYCRYIVSCFDARQMNTDIDLVKQKKIIYVDDIGTESESVKYGDRRMAFPELVDEAEKRGNLIIATTNLEVKEIREKYGERTLDRLRAITKYVQFSGESMRK